MNVKISRSAKSMVYLITSLLLLAVSVWFQLRMHRTNGLESAYFRSNLYLFALAAVCLGTAVYSFRSYTRRHSEHRGDSLFLFVVGIGLMAASVFAIVRFGGVGDTFTAQGYTAANLNIVLMTVLPAPFFLRGMALALSRREEHTGLRRAVLAVGALAAAVYLLSIALGGMLRFVHYEGGGTTGSSLSSGEIDEGKSV